jgi:hypothetical protein
MPGSAATLTPTLTHTLALTLTLTRCGPPHAGQCRLDRIEPFGPAETVRLLRLCQQPALNLPCARALGLVLLVRLSVRVRVGLGFGLG